MRKAFRNDVKKINAPSHGGQVNKCLENDYPKKKQWKASKLICSIIIMASDKTMNGEKSSPDHKTRIFR